ncbi:MAG: adenine phosphoribosyltransferase [Anaerolineaceae bacterium]|jgi:adenine phosphoribosyltransferase|nr:adenine phosphoribosyltransferase [Anaerolineaceae bacterium]
MDRKTHHVNIAGIERELPLFEVKPGLRIAVLNILGDTELVQASAKELMNKLSSVEYDLIVTAESKSIPLAHAMAVIKGINYIVLRKSYKPYMGEAIQVQTNSITTGTPQLLILDEKDRRSMNHKKVLIVDDVISTGSTLEGMRKILEMAEATIVAEVAIFTEGDPGDWPEIISLGNLPLFFD